MSLLLGLIAGALGGVMTGTILRSLTLRLVGNTVFGLIGGGVAGWLAPLGGGAADSVPAMVVTGAAGGALLCALLGVVRNAITG